MKLWNKLKELHCKIDLSKRFPNYINKSIFWGGFIIFIIYVFFIVFNYGFSSTWTYSQCNDLKGCTNPFIECKNNFFYSSACDWYNQHKCIGENCNSTFIKYNDYFGSKPPIFVEYFNLLSFFILLCTLVINHLYYMYKTVKVIE